MRAASISGPSSTFVSFYQIAAYQVLGLLPLPPDPGACREGEREREGDFLLTSQRSEVGRSPLKIRLAGQLSFFFRELWAMENWHLFTAAFVLSLVDLSVLGAFLWYQFSTLYFAWHLCPMIVNRICELIAFMFTGGMLPSLFAILQVPLSLFSTTIYANRQQRLQNKLLLAVYCTLLVYELLVAVLMIKMGRYLKYPSLRGSQQSRSPPRQQAPQPYIAFHMFALFTQPLGSDCPHVHNPERQQDSHLDGFVTVQQPDGKKVMLGKVLQSKFESSVKADVEAIGGSIGGKDTDISIIITPLTVPSEREHEVSFNQLSNLPSQIGGGPFPLPSVDGGNFSNAMSLSQSTARHSGRVTCNHDTSPLDLPVNTSIGSQPTLESGYQECENASCQ